MFAVRVRGTGRSGPGCMPNCHELTWSRVRFPTESFVPCLEVEAAFRVCFPPPHSAGSCGGVPQEIGRVLTVPGRGFLDGFYGVISPTCRVGCHSPSCLIHRHEPVTRTRTAIAVGGRGGCPRFCLYRVNWSRQSKVLLRISRVPNVRLCCRALYCRER